MRSILRVLVILGIFGLGAAVVFPKICHLRYAAIRSGSSARTISGSLG